MIEFRRTSSVLATIPDIDRLLIAGRKAAAIALYDQERHKAIPGLIDKPIDSYDGKGHLMLRNIKETDIGPAIDAAVLEAVVQMGNPNPATPRGIRWKRAAIWPWGVLRRYIARRRCVDWTSETRAQSWRLATNEFHRWVWGRS